MDLEGRRKGAVRRQGSAGIIKRQGDRVKSKKRRSEV
jgi:hypothetical protein